MGTVILGGLLRPGYSHISMAISELVADGAPNRTLLSSSFLLYNLLANCFRSRFIPQGESQPSRTGQWHDRITGSGCGWRRRNIDGACLPSGAWRDSNDIHRDDALWDGRSCFAGNDGCHVDAGFLVQEFAGP